MKILFPVALSILLVWGCKNNSTPEKETTSPSSAANEKIIPYFDFDEAAYYYYADDATKSIDSLQANEHSSVADSLKTAVLLKNTPTTLADTSFIATLEKTGYQKKNIHTSYLKEIAVIFSQKPNYGSVKANCPVVVYQHILIFRKEGHITGIARINFRCTQQQIIGTAVKTDYFGQNGDYERLEEMLEK
jgi:hypothetical protein